MIIASTATIAKMRVIFIFIPIHTFVVNILKTVYHHFMRYAITFLYAMLAFYDAEHSAESLVV